MNINIKTTYFYSAFTSLAFGIINSISSNLIYELMKENLYVGILGGIQGLVQMLVAFPLGVIADKMQTTRARLLKCLTIISFLGCLITILAVLGDHVGLPGEGFGQYIALSIACVIWGVNDGCIEPVQEALFSDSIPNGDERTKVESFRSMLRNFGAASGPLTSLLLFFFLGDHWSKENMSTVWLIGLVPLFLATISICYYSDDATIRITQTMRDPLLIVYPDENISVSSSLPEMTETLNTLEERKRCCKRRGGEKKSKRNAYLCLTSDIICALGSGMSVQFFSLFFENSVEESPIAFNITLLAAALTTAAGTYAARLAAAKFGRVRVCATFMLSGIALLISIAILLHKGEVDNPWLISILYVFRTAFMNSTNPLFTAILMDSTPSKNRGKWASLSSITTITWSGSAVFGGWVCDNHGYGVTFLITAVLQTCSLLPLLGMTGE